MVDSLHWAADEREQFRASLLPDEIRYFVDAELLATCRDAPATIPEARWRELIAQGGYHVNVLIAHGPAALALEAIASRLDDEPDTIWPFGGALAVLGAAAIPTAIRTFERAVANIGNGVYANQITTAMVDIAPVRSARIAELVLEVLASKAKPKVKASARAWLVRHAVVAKAVIEAAKADPARKKTAMAAAKAIADG